MFSSGPQEGNGKANEFVRRVPWHKMLAVIDDMDLELRIGLFQHCRAIGSMGAIVAANNHQQRHPQIHQPLPQRRLALALLRRRFCGVRSRHESLKILADALRMPKRQFFRRDEFVMIKIFLQQFARVLDRRFGNRHAAFEPLLRLGAAILFARDRRAARGCRCPAR